MIPFLPLYALHAAAQAHAARERRLERFINRAATDIFWFTVLAFIGWGAWFVWSIL